MLKIIKHLNGKEWLLIVASVIIVIFQVILDLTLPGYMSQITTLTQTPGSEISDILAAGGMMLLCALGSLTLAFSVGFLAARLSAGLSMRLREKVYDKVESFSMKEINGFSTSSLINRTTNDITQIQMIIAMGLQVAVRAPIMAVLAITRIAGKGTEWTLATAVAVLALFAMISVIVIVAVPRFKKIQGFTDNISRVTRENLTGIRVVRAYNAEQYQNDKFEEINHDMTRNSLISGRAMMILNPGMALISNGLNIAIYAIGAVMINAAMMADKMVIFSDMVVFLSYAMQIIMSFIMLTMILMIYPRAQVSALRVSEVLETDLSIKSGTKTQSVANMRGNVEFRNVTFKYTDSAEAVLENINFSAKLGETVAFIGSAGSGKSTLVNLLCRFYDVTSGEIIIDGVNIKDYTSDALNSKIGYVPQRAVLFKGTVASNVNYGESSEFTIDDDAVMEAIDIAQAKEFVMKLDNKTQSQISQGGTNLSGGQKQRISIARAIARNPEIFIFDDSFSALDYKTERVLRGRLKEKTANSTTFVVAQRIGTIKDVDKIIVLDEGKMVGMGTHDELMENCEIYRQIAYSQLDKEELA